MATIYICGHFYAEMPKWAAVRFVNRNGGVAVDENGIVIAGNSDEGGVICA